MSTDSQNNAEELPCLSFCRDVVTKHIAHPHSKEMAEKTEKVCTLCNY